MHNGNGGAGGEMPVPASVSGDDAGDAARRLAEVRAKRAALDDARARAEAVREVHDALEREERALADAEALAAAEQQYGPEGRKIRAVDTPLGLIILKRSGNAAYRRFMDAKTASTDEAERLVKPCVVYPSRAEFDRIVDEYPALWVRLAGALTVLAGHRNTELAEK
jgi:hypothetical protein